jgi:hypothetical protein
MKSPMLVLLLRAGLDDAGPDAGPVPGSGHDFENAIVLLASCLTLPPFPLVELVFGDVTNKAHTCLLGSSTF